MESECNDRGTIQEAIDLISDVQQKVEALQKQQDTFEQYVRKILDRFVKKFMLFRDDVKVRNEQ